MTFPWARRRELAFAAALLALATFDARLAEAARAQGVEAALA